MNGSDGKNAVPRRRMGLWQKFKNACPGERFVKIREYRKRMRQDCPGEKWVNILGGTLLVIVGILLIPAPGPGLPFFGAGMALLGTEFLFIARAMDLAELKACELLAKGKRWWQRRRGSHNAAFAYPPHRENVEGSLKY